MRQVIYAMRFTGRATPVGEVGGVLHVSAASPSSVMTTTMGPAGVAGDIEALPGEAATLDSDVTFTGETSFLEHGSITFGNGHRLRFTTIGSGYLGPSADPAARHGTVTWRVEEGEGQFAGASGFITANVVVDAALGVTNHHFGVLFVP